MELRHLSVGGKREVCLVRLIEGQGIRLVSRGKDLACRCLWHGRDETPSCIVTPKSNLWHCFRCDAGGTVIDCAPSATDYVLPSWSAPPRCAMHYRNISPVPPTARSCRNSSALASIRRSPNPCASPDSRKPHITAPWRQSLKIAGRATCTSVRVPWRKATARSSSAT